MNGDLWAVSCHFNPCRYARRLANFRRCRERLGVPLLAVELSHDGEFELRDSDADRVVRLRSSAVLWQKERLLNVGIAALPPSCRWVAWIDADLLFENDGWPQETVSLFGRYALLQLFDGFVDLEADQPAPDWGGARPSTDPSFAWFAAQGGRESELFDALWGSHRVTTATGTSFLRRRNSGFAWAAPRDLVARHRLYDACILGSGDRAIACAGYGRHRTAALAFLRNDAQRRHYFRWADRFAAEIHGRVHYVTGAVAHLWHGDLGDRGYRQRWPGLDPFEFDPAADLAIDAAGAWRWASDKPGMHAYVAGYFARRREDGGRAAVGFAPGEH
jgi:hypothetical protein